MRRSISCRARSADAAPMATRRFILMRRLCCNALHRARPHPKLLGNLVQASPLRLRQPLKAASVKCIRAQFRTRDCCAISVARARAALTAAFPRSSRSSARRTTFGAAKSCSLVIFTIRPPTVKVTATQIKPADRGLLMAILLTRT